MEDVALRSCRLRRDEHAQPVNSRIVDDPLARLFIRRDSLWRRTQRIPEAQGNAALCLHRLFDDVMLANLGDSAVQQVIIIDAGYNSRAWRLVDALKGCPVYEVDLPNVLRHKASCLTERPLPVVPSVSVPVDPTQALSAALEGAGAQRGLRSLVLWELGPLYRSRASVKATLATMRALNQSGSILVMGSWQWPDLPNEPTPTTFLGKTLRFLLHPEDVDAFLTRQGFTTREIIRHDDLVRRYAIDERPLSRSLYAIIAQQR